MSLKCRVFGHKTVRGDIETYGEVLRCQRCNRQVIYPEADIIENTLRSLAEANYRVAELLDSEDNGFKEDAERFEKAADILSNGDEE